MKNRVARLLLVSILTSVQIYALAQNVGIGIDTPNYTLQIHDTTNLSILQFTSDGTGATPSDGFVIGQNYGDGEVLLWNRENEDIKFGTNSFERMRITADGKIGIGTPFPNYDLHVHNVLNPARMQFTTPLTGTTSGDGFVIGHNSESGQGLIWNRENEDIVFRTGDFGIMVMKLGGNIGIGTSSPNYDLHINSFASTPRLQFTSESVGTTSLDGFIIGHSDGAGEVLLWNMENRGIKFATNDMERMHIQADGKIGMGIDTPNYDLHVHNSLNPARLQFTSPFTGTTSGDGFIIGHNSETGQGLIWNRENEDIVFFTNDIIRMKIAADGKVGIGNISPTSDLHVHNSDNPARLHFTSPFTGTTLDDGFIIGQVTEDGKVYMRNMENKDMELTTGKDIAFATNSIERMRIQANGNVGIGTTSPDYPLEVVSATTRTGNFENTSTTQDYSGIFGSCNNTPNYGYGVYGLGGWIGVEGEATLAGTGSRYGLYGYAFGGDVNNWAVYSSGSSYATGTWQTSDAMFKKDIRPIENALNIIKRLKPRGYNYKTEVYDYMGLPAEPQYGFLAQDMENVLPELVRDIEQPIDHASKDNGMIQFKGINYTELIPVTIAAMQEQQKTIEELQNQVEQLLSRIETLEKK